MLTEGDIRLHPGVLAPHSPTDRSAYLAFRATDATALTTFFAEEAELQLLRHRIDEPLRWQPSVKDPDGATWNPPEPDRDRRLSGWTAQQREPGVGNGPRVHTPSWYVFLEDLFGYPSLLHLFRDLHALRAFPERYDRNDADPDWFDSAHNPANLPRWATSRFGVRLLHLGSVRPTVAGDELLDAFLYTFGTAREDPWEEVAVTPASPAAGGTSAGRVLPDCSARGRPAADCGSPSASGRRTPSRTHA